MTNAKSHFAETVTWYGYSFSHNLIVQYFLFQDEDLKTKAITLLCFTLFKGIISGWDKAPVLPDNCSDGRRDVQNPSETSSSDFPWGHRWQWKQKSQKHCGCQIQGPAVLLLWRIPGIVYKRWACLVLWLWALLWKDLWSSWRWDNNEFRKMKGSSEVHLARPPAIKRAYVPQAQTMEIILYLMFLDVKKKKVN